MQCDKCQKWGEKAIYKCHIPGEYQALDDRYGAKSEIKECKFFRERKEKEPRDNERREG